MLLDGVAPKDMVVLVDTNVMLEAVRTRCWNALTGGLGLETVQECRDEALRGDRLVVCQRALEQSHSWQTCSDSPPFIGTTIVPAR